MHQVRGCAAGRGRRGAACLLDVGGDCLVEVAAVDEQQQVCRSVHTLQEAVVAVERTVAQLVGIIERHVFEGGDAFVAGVEEVFSRRRCQYECGHAFLHLEVLALAVKYFPVVTDRDVRNMRVELLYTLC